MLTATHKGAALRRGARSGEASAGPMSTRFVFYVGTGVRLKLAGEHVIDKSSFGLAA